MTEEKEITRNEATHRFEMKLDPGLAYIPYQIKGDVLSLYYIFVPPAERGRGLSGQLIRFALAFAREHHLALEIHCSYIAKYLSLHPELDFQPAGQNE